MKRHSIPKFRDAPSLCLLGLVSVCLVGGCSSRTPSDGDGENAIQSRIAGESQSRIKLARFEKTNGQRAEANGVRLYTLEYEAEIEFLETCKWNIRTLGGTMLDSEITFRTTMSSEKPANALTELMDASTNPGTAVSKGQKVKLVGFIQFEMKEKGWSVDFIKVKSIVPLAGSFTSPQTRRAENGPIAQTSVGTEITDEEKQREKSKCIQNLKQLAFAFKGWALDYRDEFPFNVSTNEGGTMELCSPGPDGFDSSSIQILQIVSSKLTSTDTLTCPADRTKHPAPDFSKLLAINVSYQVHSGKNVTDTQPNEVLVRCPIHNLALLCDGSIQQSATIPSQNPRGQENEAHNP